MLAVEFVRGNNMYSGSEIEGLISAFVGFPLMGAAFFAIFARAKKPHFANACLISGAMLSISPPVVFRLELWTSTWASISNQLFLFMLVTVLFSWVYQAWSFDKSLSKAETPSKV